MDAISKFKLAGIHWGNKSDLAVNLAIKEALEQGTRGELKRGQDRKEDRGAAQEESGK